MSSFLEFLRERLETSGFATEDVLASFLPLMRQVVAAHSADKVAPLEGVALRVEQNVIWFEESQRRELRENYSALERVAQAHQAAVEVVGEVRVQTYVDEGRDEIENLRIGKLDEPVTRPVYLPGFVAWEHRLGHHDPLTDVYSLGLILASLACGLDLSQPAELESFVASRENLFHLSRGLHPVLARAVLQMTELDRHRRPQNLAGMLHALENYRDQTVDFELDLARVEGFGTKDLETRQQVVLAKLQERLFDLSRRNRLLHFRSTMQSINLTQASVPLSFDPQHIRPDQILTWGGQFRDEVSGGKRISLNKYVNFEEVLYAPGVLDHIRAEARRDQAEFGFAQLRLVLCFLRWADLKQSPPERYDSPLVLLPVKLIKKKGIRDTYHVEPLTAEAEINPVLRHQFKQLYDIDLPETIDLETTTLDTLYQHLRARIEASEPAVRFDKLERPRIDLIHDKARRRLDQYRRRARLAGRGVRRFLDLDYSYDPANYHPLGISLFAANVRPATTHLHELVEETPRPRQFAVPANESEVPAEKERSFYHLRDSAGDDPYAWQFDLCRVTLGNFRYRKMSLVRDYAELVRNQHASSAFDATFSLVPRAVDSDPPVAPALEDRFHVVPCDPTQAAAIGRAASAASYIIQGPPGTGKSQTITNLIADYVARGRRVLFVCEKRAAIDVVYARLRQQGLHELCCLIHDSQSDKKAFVMDLKATYETFLGDEAQATTASAQARADATTTLQRELEPLAAFDAAMRTSPPEAGLPVHQLLRRLAELREHMPVLSALQAERLPNHATWLQCRDGIERLAAALADIQADGVLQHHPLHRLQPALADAERPLQKVTSALDMARRELQQVAGHVSDAQLLPGDSRTIADLDRLLAYARQIAPLASHEQLAVLVDGTPEAQQLQHNAALNDQVLDRLDQCRADTVHWREKLSREETDIALEQAEQLESSLFGILRPGWWRLRKTLNRVYDFGAHTVKPSWRHVLRLLQQEHLALADRSQHASKMRAAYGFEGDPASFLTDLSELRATMRRWPAELLSVHEQLVDAPDAAERVQAILRTAPHVESLRAALDRFLEDYDALDLNALRTELERIDDALDDLNDFLVCLAELAALPDDVSAAIRQSPADTTGLEAAVAHRSLEAFYRQNRAARRFSGPARDRHARRLERAYDRWLKSNAGGVREIVRQRFVEHVRLSQLPASQLDAEQKEFKKHYNRGRRELEHEFGKTMRYKPIRDLVADESGLVIKDLKPVWLMSPLSVSDTLPLEGDYFDVVIFDEASQITLEEAVPSIFRAPQAIVVGDEMQLPPTNFFATRAADEESLLLEEDDELVEYDLTSDSFLNHAGKNLPSSMLGWHYRSRSESLISFSNWAFYEGRLLTVPEEQLMTRQWPELRFDKAEDGAAGADALVGRPISFHLLDHGVYQRRRNRAEADYIAHMVRQLLATRPELSIGIVAFSEAQQGEIDAALARLAEEDAAFRDRLEVEFEREEDGQFVGLLVKNLENIQGDERDVVIMSVCYGHGPDGKMLMNFGPINRSGGEKRLNVAFSRAKHHMALVSSIQYTDITNDYNDGAHCLKNYLRYAAAMSVGSVDAARQVLHEMTLRRTASDSVDEISEDPVSRQLAAALTERGYLVDLGVGQSHFRCDLAVRREGDDIYRLGVLVDHDGYYRQDDLLEREMMRPRLLRVFGWQVACVLAKDWYEEPDEVLERLERALSGQQPPIDDDEPDDQGSAGVGPTEASQSSEGLAQPPARAVSASDTYPDGSPSDSSAAITHVADTGDLEDRRVTSTASTAELRESGPEMSDPISQPGARYFELVGGRSEKFWEICVNDASHTVRFGRIGSVGQTRTRTFSDADTAKRDAERLIAQQLRKGYEEK